MADYVRNFTTDFTIPDGVGSVVWYFDCANLNAADGAFMCQVDIAIRWIGGVSVQYGGRWAEPFAITSSALSLNTSPITMNRITPWEATVGSTTPSLTWEERSGQPLHLEFTLSLGFTTGTKPTRVYYTFWGAGN
jgi:hypothetical protein